MKEKNISGLISWIEKFEILEKDEVSEYINEYNALIDKMILENCKNPRAFAFYNQNYNSALFEARQGKLIRAEYLIDRAKVFLSNRDFDSLETDIYKIISFPIEAYLLHKKEGYSDSMSLLMETMNLHEKYCPKYPFLVFHKIQQIHNVIRIYFKRGDYLLAGCLIENILNYIVNEEEFKFENIDFKINRDIEKYLPMKTAMTEQILFESLSVCQNLQAEDKDRIEKKCFEIFHKQECLIGGWIRNWIDVTSSIKNDLLNSDVSKVISVFNNYGNNLGNFPVFHLYKSIIASIASSGLKIDISKCQSTLLKFEKARQANIQNSLSKAVS